MDYVSSLAWNVPNELLARMIIKPETKARLDEAENGTSFFPQIELESAFFSSIQVNLLQPSKIVWTSFSSSKPFLQGSKNKEQANLPLL